MGEGKCAFFAHDFSHLYTTGTKRGCKKNKFKMRTYGIIRNDLAVIAFLINAACIVMYEQVQENANVEIYARMAYMDTMTGLGNRTVSVTESAVMSS